MSTGIDPKETIAVTRWKGLLIAFGGFILSSLTVVLPLYAFQYKHWFVLCIASVAGSIGDFVWALSMLGSKTITLHARK